MQEFFTIHRGGGGTKQIRKNLWPTHTISDENNKSGRMGPKEETNSETFPSQESMELTGGEEEMLSTTENAAPIKAAAIRSSRVPMCLRVATTAVR